MLIELPAGAWPRGSAESQCSFPLHSDKLVGVRDSVDAVVAGGSGTVGVNISEEQRKKAAASETGWLLLLAVACALFFLSGMESRRKTYFWLFGYPSVPKGNFAPIHVLSSRLERNAFASDRYVLIVERTAAGTIHENRDEREYPVPGTIYTLDCTPHFWNLCAGLAPDRDYYARWASSDQQQIAVAEVVSEADGKSYIPAERARVFDVNGWKKIEE